MKPQHLAVIGGRLDREDLAGMLAVALANDLVQRGHRITLLSPAAVEHELDERVTLLTPNSGARVLWLGLVRYRRWVASTLADLQPDHAVSLLSTVPAEIMVPSLGLVSARIRATMLEPAAIHTRIAQHLAFLMPSIVLSRLHEKQALANENLKTIIALSEQIKTDLQAAKRHPLAEIHRASVAIPERQRDAPDASVTRATLARALGLRSEAYWIMLPFRTAGLGGLEPMLRAFKPLIEQGVDAMLLLVGPARYTHLAWIAELGLRERVRFVGKSALQEELAAASDLIVCPSNYDPVGWSVRPALTEGKPTITTTACDLADAVQQQGGSVLAAPADPQALLEAIRQHHTDWQGGDQASNPPHGTETPPEPLLAEVIEGVLDE